MRVRVPGVCLDDVNPLRLSLFFRLLGMIADSEVDAREKCWTDALGSVSRVDVASAVTRYRWSR